MTDRGSGGGVVVKGEGIFPSLCVIFAYVGWTRCKMMLHYDARTESTGIFVMSG